MAFANKHYFSFSLEAYLVTLTWRAISKHLATKSDVKFLLRCIRRLLTYTFVILVLKIHSLLRDEELSFYLYRIQSVHMLYSGKHIVIVNHMIPVSGGARSTSTAVQRRPREPILRTCNTIPTLRTTLAISKALASKAHKSFSYASMP